MEKSLILWSGLSEKTRFSKNAILFSFYFRENNPQKAFAEPPSHNKKKLFDRTCLEPSRQVVFRSALQTNARTQLNQDCSLKKAIEETVTCKSDSNVCSQSKTKRELQVLFHPESCQQTETNRCKGYHRELTTTFRRLESLVGLIILIKAQPIRVSLCNGRGTAVQVPDSFHRYCHRPRYRCNCCPQASAEYGT